LSPVVQGQHGQHSEILLVRKQLVRSPPGSLAHLDPMFSGVGPLLMSTVFRLPVLVILLTAVVDRLLLGMKQYLMFAKCIDNRSLI
jgi:hypothetical protein